MASKIKGITIEIGGNTQPLQEAIKKVDSTAKNLKTELSSINRLLKFDPSNVTLLTQKQEVLARSIQATEEKVQKLKLAQKQAKDQLANGDIGEEQYRALEREVISAEGALNNLKKQAQEVEDALSSVGKESENSAGNIDAFGKNVSESGEETRDFSEKAKASFTAASAAILASVAAVGKFTSKIKDASGVAAGYADDINTMAAQYRISTETLQRFAYAADIVDVSLETFGASLGKLTRNIGNAEKGTEDQVKAFEDLKVSIYDANGELRDSEDVFYDVIDALGKMDNETKADIAANALFGRSFQDLNPLVIAGTDRLRELGNEAERVGAVMSQDALDSANAYQDSLDRLKGITGAVERSFSFGMTPALERVTNLINDKLADPATQRKIEQFGNVIGDAIENFADFALVVIENGDAVVGVVTSIGAGVAAWKVSSVIGNAIVSFQNFAKTAKESGAGVVGAIKNIDKASMSTIIGTIVAVVGVISTLVMEAGKASDEISALKDAAETLKKDSADLANEFERTNQAFIINSQKATALAEDIEQLNKKIESGSLSSEDMAKAQAELTKSVAEYNAIVEGAALTIDEETGAIQGGTAALKANTKELIANARATAYVELYAEAVKGATQAEIEREAALSALRGEMDGATETQKAWISAVIESGGKQEYLTTLWYNASIVSDNFNGSIMAGVEAIENANAAYDKNSATLRMIESSAADAGISLDKTTEVIEESGEVVVETTEKIRQMTNDEITWLNNLVDAATDTNNEIVLSEQKSFEDRKKILDKNKEVVADFVENRNYLMNQVSRESQFVLSEMTINDARTLKDMVELWKNGGQDQVNAYIESLLDVFGEEAPIFAGAVVSQTEDAIEAGKEVASQQAGTVGERMASAIVEKYDEGSEKIENTAKTQIRDVFKEINSQVTQLQFATIGNRIGKDIAEGLRESYSVIDSAASSVARRIRNRLNFNVSVNGATKIPGAASGAIVSQEQIIRVAERGPEAIIPLDKLGAIMQSAINGRGQVSFSPVINFNATKVSDAEAMRLARIVSREFARATGGRMG